MSEIKLNSETMKLIDEAKEEFGKFLETVARLRDKNNGCPWDVKQTIKSLRSFMLEEAYEAAEAMGEDDMDHVAEELGDVLLQVVLNSQVAFEENKFTIKEVISSVNEKMISRHPHVFDHDSKLMDINTPEDVKKQWDELKEKSTTDTSSLLPYTKKMKRERHPASSHAFKIGKVAAKANFDWSSKEEVFRKLESEIKEVAVELKIENNLEKITDELGDVYFSLAQVCRHLGLDPELVAMQGNQKFLKRFEKLEKDFVDKKEDDFKNVHVSDKEKVWIKIKDQEI